MTKQLFLYAAICAILLWTRVDIGAGLMHRYSFTNGDANAVDSVGGSSGTLEGGASISGNALVLDGTNDFVNLPSQLIGGYTTISFEAWFTASPTSGQWARIWDFGDTNPGSGNGRDYVFLTPKSDSITFRYAISDADPGYDHENIVQTAPTPTAVPVYVAVVHNGTGGSVQLYVNGSPAANGTFTIPLSSVNNVFSYLGKSLYNVDPYFKGSIDEFRIYNSVLTAEEIAQHYIDGPDLLRPPPITIEQTNGSTEVSEANSIPDTYTITLSSQPQAAVTLTINPDSNLDVGSGPDNPLDIVFDTNNWSSPRTIEVWAVDNNDLESNPLKGSITHRLSSSDPDFNNVPAPSLIVDILDNECGAWAYNYADLNFDCFVDFKDSAILADSWLSRFDIDNLQTLVLDWLRCTVPYAPLCERGQYSPPRPGYLFSYFTSETGGLRLSYSYDGLSWTVLNDGASFLVPNVGSNLMRDPCILRGPDGIFRMVWTTGWSDKGIGYAYSSDLINWSEQIFIPVMASQSGAQNCWAPEVFYDAARQRYQIFWATTITGQWNNEHRIYYVTTEDFNSFSNTSMFFEQGFNVIDATILEENQQFYMFVKNETDKIIRMTTSANADGPWGPVSNPISPAWCEGPTAVKVEDKFLLYFDKYTQGTYGLMESNDLQIWLDSTTQLNMPSGARHGTVCYVSGDIIENLKAY